MKIRNGFVSNSSTSSFVVVCKEEDHKKALKKLHPYYQKWINTCHHEKQEFLGHNILVFCLKIYSEDEEPMKWNKSYPEEAVDFFGDGNKMVPGDTIMYKYIDELKKISKDLIINRENS